MTGIRKGANQLPSFVKGVRRATGAKQVDLIDHSQGGTVIAYYLKFGGGARRTSKAISLAGPNASGLISNILTPRSAAPINCRRVIPFFGVDDDDPGKVIPPALSCGVRREWAPRGDLAAQSAHASTLVAGVRQGSAPPPPTAAAPR